MTLANPTASAAALCQVPGFDPVWWDNDDPVGVSKAVAVCGRCPEEQACLIWALKTRQRGPAVYGGFWFQPPNWRALARRAS